MPRETIGYNGNRTVVKWRKDDENPDFPNTPGNVTIAVLNPAIEDPDQTGVGGFYADLDEDQIDYLIAVLKKARRQAYLKPRPGQWPVFQVPPRTEPAEIDTSTSAGPKTGW